MFRSSLGAPRPSNPLDIRLRQASIRTLNRRRAPTHRSTDAIERVRGEFVEMRGFSPTLEQAARLFNLPTDECYEVLAVLVREGFLRRAVDGRYRLPPQD